MNIAALLSSPDQSASGRLSSASGRLRLARVTKFPYAATHDETSPDRRERKRPRRQPSQLQPRPKSPEKARPIPPMLPAPLRQEYETTNFPDHEASPIDPPGGMQGYGDASLGAPDENGSRKPGPRRDWTAFNSDPDETEDEPISDDEDMLDEDSSSDHVLSTTHPNSPPQRSEAATSRSGVPGFSQPVSDVYIYYTRLTSVSEAWRQYKKGAAPNMPPLGQLEKDTVGRWRAKRWFAARQRIAIYVEKVAESAECSPEDVCKGLDDKFHRRLSLVGKLLADGEDPMTVDLDQVQGEKGK